MKLLNDEQQKVLKEILEIDGLKGKNELAYVLWANSTAPKYNKGECFIVNDYSREVLGEPMVNIKAKIVSVSFAGNCMNGNHKRKYKLSANIFKGEKYYVAYFYVNEDKLCKQCDGNDNIFKE